VIRLEKLTIRKLGNIAPDTELHFSARGALLLGKNGTGKSTLLNVIVAALRSDWKKLTAMSDEGFDLGYSLRVSCGPEESFLLDVSMRGRARPGADPMKPPFETGSSLEPELSVSVFDVAGDRLLLSSTEHNQTKLTYQNRPAGQQTLPAMSPASALLLGDDEGHFAFDSSVAVGEMLRKFVELLSRYDEAYQYFDNLTCDNGEPKAQAAFYYQGEEIQKAAHSSTFFSARTCALLRHRLASEKTLPDHLRIETSFTKAHHSAAESLAWLEEFCSLSHFDRSSITFPLISSKRSSNTTIAHYGPMSLRYSVHETSLRGDQLSFGQKRLFSLLHYLDANEHIAIADELVNGLHHGWIERCVEILRERQAFLSSQNPILFDFMDFASAEDAASRFIECRTDEQGRFVWRNMSLADGNEFYELYKTGIQQVSEILWTRGFW
jgi:energy-coupling factor transporter ATP-binding protein EcfA2